MREKYFSNIINLKLSKSKRLCLNIFQIKKKLLEKISREKHSEGPKQADTIHAMACRSLVCRSLVNRALFSLVTGDH